MGFVRKNKKAVNRWLRTKVLIIDEGEWVGGLGEHCEGVGTDEGEG